MPATCTCHRAPRREPRGHHVLDHLHQVGHLGVVTVPQILSGTDEHGDVLDADGLAPGQYLLGVFSAGAVAQARVGHARLPGPSAVTIHDQPDVPGEPPRQDLAAQSAGIQHVDAGHCQ
jgi:hypothetical protein